jgi:membrane protein implicated in regulation of membrane protease activity
MGLEFSLPPAVYVWLCVAIGLVILEIFTVGFFVVFFGIGALVAAGVACFFHSTLMQVLAFALSSLAFVFWGRPFVKKLLNMTDQPAQLSNVSALIGTIVLVMEPVTRHGGRVKALMTGETWGALLAPTPENTASSSSEIPVGQEAVVVALEGARLIIRQ